MFKVDTGAEVTAISKNAFHSLGDAQLQKSSKILYGPESKPLDVMGEFTQELSCRGTVTKQSIFVVKGLTRNLLGLPAIMALDLVTRVDAVEDKVDDYSLAVRSAHPTVFQGLGEFGEPYRIKLLPDAKSHALFTPRRIPIPIRSKVKEELTKMEAQGVISKVNQPTQWCSGMVAVPKKSGSVRICVDLQRLNECVQ